MYHLQQLFSDYWAIRRPDFENTLSIVMPCLMRGNANEAIAMLSAPKCQAKAIAGPKMSTWYELDDPALPANAIAVISLSGPLYSWETDWLIRQISTAGQNPAICGLILDIDGPGGMSSHIDQAVSAIENLAKPTATVVSGCMASAHFWLGTATGRSFIMSPLCEVGSVGVFIPYCSLTEYLSRNGIDYREIYPDTADLKNAETRAIEQHNDESLIKARGEQLHRMFSETVARNLGITYDPSLPLFRGAMFMAGDAVEAGYIDQWGDIKDAAVWVLAQATRRQAEQMYD